MLLYLPHVRLPHVAYEVPHYVLDGNTRAWRLQVWQFSLCKVPLTAAPVRSPKAAYCKASR